MTAPYTDPRNSRVKTESSPSPELINTGSSELDHPPSQSLNSIATNSTPPLFRFGLDQSNENPTSMSWQDGLEDTSSMGLASVSFLDDFDDGSEIVEISSITAGSSGASDKHVRRRSSKGVHLNMYSLFRKFYSSLYHSMRPVPEVQMQVRAHKLQQPMPKLRTPWHTSVFPVHVCST